MEIHLEEIILEEITKRDVKPFFEMMNNNRHLLERYFPITVENTRTPLGTEYYLESVIRKRNNNEMIVFGIRYQKKLIGIFHIKNIEWRIPKCELSYFLDKDYQGKGIMDFLFARVIKMCFQEFKMNKIFVRITPDNTSSRKLALKHGFKTEGILEKEFKIETGELVDLEYLGLVNPELK